MRRFRHLSKTDRLRIEAHARDGKTPKEIAEIIAMWTGIPVKTLEESESQRLLRLEEILHQVAEMEGDVTYTLQEPMFPTGS